MIIDDPALALLAWLVLDLPPGPCLLIGAIICPTDSVLVLFLGRPPAILLTARLVCPVRSRADIGLVGWFGPIGIAAVYYGSMATLCTGDARVWYVTSLIVASSVLAHGLSSTAFTQVYGRTRRRRS